MSQSASGRVFMASDMQYLITFATGMGAFWLGGQAVSRLPQMADPKLAAATGLATTALIFGLGMALVAIVMLRRLAVKAVLAAALLAVLLGAGAAQLIILLAKGHIHTMLHLGLLTFVLYLCYGTIYVVGLAVAKRLARA